MKKLKVLVLMHSDLIPPDDLTEISDPRMEKFRTEFDVKTALRNLGHEVLITGVADDVAPIRRAIEEWQPDIAFNLMEAFAYDGALDYYIVTYLDIKGIPYTGCNPRGMILARDKALSKKLLHYHRIATPKFMVFPYGRRSNMKQLAALPYPMIVKTLSEQGSIAIAQSSIVYDAQQLLERVQQVQQMIGHDVIAEQYIDGRELYVSVLGNDRLQVLPIREIVFDGIDDGMHRIASYSVKWNRKYRERWGIDYQFARNLPGGMTEKITHLAKRVYHILELSGYARLDLRLSADGKLYVLEANPNAAIASIDDLAFSAAKAGFSYEQLIQRILTLGLRSQRPL